MRKVSLKTFCGEYIFIISFRYNIKTNTWSPINPLPEPLSNMAGCVSYKEQLIFISGGYNKHEASNHVLQFDPLNENIGYEILPHLMFHRAGHIMTIVNINDEDRLLVIGGNDHPYNGRIVWQIEIFDVGMERWLINGRIHMMGPFSKINRVNFCQDDLNGVIYIWAIDFINTDKTILRYEFKRQLWSVQNQSDVDLPLYEISISDTQCV